MRVKTQTPVCYFACVHCNFSSFLTFPPGKGISPSLTRVIHTHPWVLHSPFNGRSSLAFGARKLCVHIFKRQSAIRHACFATLLLSPHSRQGKGSLPLLHESSTHTHGCYTLLSMGEAPCGARKFWVHELKRQSAVVYAYSTPLSLLPLASKE